MRKLRFSLIFAAAAGLLAGCSEPRPAEPRAHGARPAPGPAEPAKPPGEAAEPPGGQGAEPARASVPKLVAELDHPDQRRVFHATMQLLDARADRRALPAIAERLKGARAEQQRHILSAIARFVYDSSGPLPRPFVKEIIDLVAPFLGHSEPDLRKDAVEAFAALDALDKRDGEEDAADLFVRRVLDAPKDLGPSVAERVSAVRVIGRKPADKAVSILRAAFERASIADVKEAVRKELERVTGQVFRDPQQIRVWWEKNQHKSPDQWYQERIEQEVAEKIKFREAARANWRRLMINIATNQNDRYYDELKDSLATDQIPQIRSEAARKLLESGRADAYDVLVDALHKETDIEAKCSMLIDALAKQPPSAPEVRERVIQKVLPLTAAPEKDVRLAAVTALGELRAEAAVPYLLDRIANKNRDIEVATATLQALAKIGARAEGRVGKELVDFLRQELDRPANDPLRDLRLLEQAAGTLGGLQYEERSPEADRAVELLVRALDFSDASDPRAASRVRQVALLALNSLKRPAALKALIPVLDDRDDQIASEAARALGSIAGGKLAADKDRAAALVSLQRVFDGTRAPVKDAALDAIREVLKVDPSNLAPFRDVAERLGQSKDYDRIVKLLRELPQRLGPEATADARKTHTELRAMLANAYENATPPDPKTAVEIWTDLAKADPERFLERRAFALASLPSEAADEVYADLIKRRPADALRYWQARIALARRFVDLDRRMARDLVDRMKLDQANMPPGLKADVEALEAQLRTDGGRGEGTVPSGMRAPVKGGP